MGKSITETLKKINIELSGGVFYSILISLLILDIYIGFKIYSVYKSKNSDHLIYQKASINNSRTNSNQNSSKVYASSKGSKYYLPNCKSSIKEENKVYFDTETEAKNAGYQLSKSCE
jgi:hypothetical protein